MILDNYFNCWFVALPHLETNLLELKTDLSRKHYSQKLTQVFNIIFCTPDELYASRLPLSYKRLRGARPLGQK